MSFKKKRKKRPTSYRAYLKELTAQPDIKYGIDPDRARCGKQTGVFKGEPHGTQNIHF